MKPWVLACSLLGFLAGSVSAGPARTSGVAEDCPTARPAVLTKALTPVVGKSPLWLTWGTGPVPWKSANDPVQLMFVRDRSVPGQAFVSGKHRGSNAPLRFTKFGETLGTRLTRYTLAPLGWKPSLAKAEDFDKYEFDRVFGWFAEAGCFEITARVGRQQSTMYLQVGKSK
jgi:hypothetical protein